MTEVAVLFGGWSAERPVSLASGAACADALEGEGFSVTRIDAGRNIASVLSDLKPDVVFNALHGPFGEDGCIQGILEVLGLPYTHSGVLASSLAMDKTRAKSVLAAAGIPLATGRLVARTEAARSHVLPKPYVLKPNGEGSSFGVFIVREDMEHPPQELHGAEWAHGDMLLAEEYIPGRELTCAVMGDEALGVTEIIVEDRFYDFDAKYAAGGSRHVCPADIKPDVYHEVRNLSLKAHRALGCRGVSRADFRFDEANGRLICLEVNTQPGMTPTSLVPELANEAGLSFGQLVRWMVEDASCRR